ncbi:hypothetical protein [Hahella sp. HN01]|uniref:hypothetical protein n=1 Tax=Hahella sp. HN01 TaxID=2847262 RepID=UPI001C1EFF35|nr:hypothetical protein [Hahella sp. HN01]MBU6954791.1 hypothetical protein [Hahella sp. HN01]
MKYFLFNCLGNRDKEEYCFTVTTPDGGVSTYDLTSGLRLSDEYPDGIEPVFLKLDDRFPGLELASYIGNASNLLSFHISAANLIHQLSECEIELVPFTLLNPKGNVHSEEYVFVNPVGAIDCVNWNETVCTRRKNGDIANYKKIVMDKSKAKDFPNLFRIQNKSSLCVFSETIVDALMKAHHNNLVFIELEVA